MKLNTKVKTKRRIIFIIKSFLFQESFFVALSLYGHDNLYLFSFSSIVFILNYQKIKNTLFFYAI